jgi:hypothetical protein
VPEEAVVDGGLERAHAGVAVAPDAPDRDLGEDPFDEVQPGRAGRREAPPDARA